MTSGSFFPSHFFLQMGCGLCVGLTVCVCQWVNEWVNGSILTRPNPHATWQTPLRKVEEKRTPYSSTQYSKSEIVTLDLDLHSFFTLHFLILSPVSHFGLHTPHSTSLSNVYTLSSPSISISLTFPFSFSLLSSFLSGSRYLSRSLCLKVGLVSDESGADGTGWKWKHKLAHNILPFHPTIHHLPP